MVKDTDKRELHNTPLTQLCALLRKHDNCYDFYENNKDFPVAVWKDSDNGPYECEVTKVCLENDSQQKVVLIIESNFIYTWPDPYAIIPLEDFEDDTVSILIDAIGE